MDFENCVNYFYFGMKFSAKKWQITTYSIFETG
jgi:hypothetical protein